MVFMKYISNNNYATTKYYICFQLKKPKIFIPFQYIFIKIIMIKVECKSQNKTVHGARTFLENKKTTR